LFTGASLVVFSFSVYVFLGASKSLVDMMNTMQALQLFDNGDYMVIYGDTNINTYNIDTAEYLWSNLTGRTFKQLNVFL